jgi:hypothetical protein
MLQGRVFQLVKEFRRFFLYVQIENITGWNKLTRYFARAILIASSVLAAKILIKSIGPERFRIFHRINLNIT